MSIDLSSITEIRDKIGIITKITDASGMVLWSVAKMVVVTLESDLPSGGSTAMGIGYNTEDGSYVEISSAGTYELPLGTVIDFWIGPEKGSGSADIYINDEYVTGSRDGEKCSYYHTLTTNIIISVSIGSGYGAFYITEVPENCIVFSISGDYAGSYTAEDGMTWAEWFASSYNTTGKTADDVSAITDSNGNVVNLTDVIVNGTAYEVGFDRVVIVNLICPDGNGDVTIDGTKYIRAGTYEAIESVIVRILGYYGMVNGSIKTAPAYLYLNNVQVAQTPSNPPITYDYSLSLEGCTEVTIEYKNENPTYTTVYNCYITTT